MKISLAFVRIDIPGGPHYRLVVNRHYQDGTDRRALTAAAYGTIAQNVHVLLEWPPFDFALKGGFLIDPEVLIDQMDPGLDDAEFAAQLDAARKFIEDMTSSVAAFAKKIDPIPDDEQGQNRP